MNNYIGTDNAELLEHILNKQLTAIGLSVAEAAKIARDDRAPRDDILVAINWCQNVVKEYIGITGALCKGELKVMGGRVLDVPEWKFNQYIMERHITKADNMDLKEMLLKDSVKYEKLFALIQELETPRMLAYKKVVQHNHIVWFTDMNKALKYVNDFLTEPYEVGQLSKKEFKKQIHKKNLYIPIPSLNSAVNNTINEESDKIITPADFAVKYYLDDKSFKGGQSAMINSRENVDRALMLGGLANQDDRESMVRRIIQNYRLASILKISGSDDYSREKIKKLGETTAEPNKHEELLSDISRVFEH